MLDYLSNSTFQIFIIILVIPNQKFGSIWKIY